MSACSDCSTAKADRLWGGFHANCTGCRARSLARSPQFFAAKTADKTTHQGRQAREAYKRLLAQVGVEHSEVTSWSQS